MSMSFFHRHGFICIIALGVVFLYSFQLTSIPNGFYNDEASIAVNARQIITTGQDEHGISFPLYFKAFGEYKNPLYIYTTSVFFLILGASDHTLRLVSVLFGLLSVLLVYIIGNKIFQSKPLGIIGAILLAITPWHFEMSRIGFEVASTTSIILASLYFLLSWQQDNKKIIHLLLGSFFVGLYLYSYTTARLFSPILFGIFTLLNITSFWKQKNYFLFYFVTYIIVILPFILFYFFQPDFNNHFASISVFNSINPLGFLGNNIIAYLSPAFLFITGDTNIRHHFAGSGVGELYWMYLPLLLVGLYTLFHKYPRKLALFISINLLLFPLAGSLTTEGIPHALRAFQAIAWLIIPIAIGGYTIIKLSQKWLRWSLLVIIGLGLIIQSTAFFLNYFSAYSTYAYTPASWQKEEQDINQYLLQNGENYAIIYESFSGRNQPMIFHKWYLPPSIIQRIMPIGRTAITPDKTKKTLIIIPVFMQDQLKSFPYKVVYTITDPYHKKILFLCLEPLI